MGELGGLGKTKNCSVCWDTFGAKVLYLDLILDIYSQNQMALNIQTLLFVELKP